MCDWSKLCIRPGRFLLPNETVDISTYAVVACDQYTAQPEYWQAVENIVQDKPSAYRMILPECYLADSKKRIPAIHAAMRRYLADGTLSKAVNGMVLTRRTTASGARLGLLMCVDLEQYDYAPDSLSPIRVTEGTITSRIPPRLQVRADAPLELSHVLLLTDDPKCTLIEPLYAARDKHPKLYDTELMQGGGHLEGWAIEDKDTLSQIYTVVSEMTERAGENGIVFAVGDGNHSLATARAHWLNVRKDLPKSEWAAHPARYAMVELINLHDPALQFEPIHRVLFNISASKVKALLADCQPVCEPEQPDIVLVHQGGDLPLKITKPLHALTVGTVQKLLDKADGLQLDYVHGEEAVRTLVEEQNAVGILLPAMDKAALFPAVLKDGALPRKTFSMGEANEKRFYLEARSITKDC